MSNTASVVGNALIVFTDKVGQTHKTNLLGFTQLEAIQQGKDPKAEGQDYYNAVTDMMGNIGFNAERINFRQYEAPTPTIELDPRWMARRSMISNQASTFVQPEAEVGEKWTWIPELAADLGQLGRRV